MNCSTDTSDSRKNWIANALTGVSVKRTYVTSVCLWFTFTSSIMWVVGSGARCEVQGGALPGGADKTLVRPTSRCRMTETIASERGVCSCAEVFASLFLLPRLKGSMFGDARDFNNVETRTVIKLFFSPARQSAEGNSRHSDINIRETCTIVCHRQKMGGPV